MTLTMTTIAEANEANGANARAANAHQRSANRVASAACYTAGSRKAAAWLLGRPCRRNSPERIDVLA
jgi:hypothetical protein